ncbi:hypothetical protein [Psychrobacter jeotgali]|uniref:hypothetical protein n=1 Tax=Psychrobacter jeotgali TaxID=179010 RepID=UPI00191AB890|nr:hypothetical protein [Psychrobacter jeotgali]
MSTSKDINPDKNKDYELKDAGDNEGIVPDDALQKVNPAAAEKATADHDIHNVAKNVKQYDTDLTENKK